MIEKSASAPRRQQWCGPLDHHTGINNLAAETCGSLHPADPNHPNYSLCTAATRNSSCQLSAINPLPRSVFSEHHWSAPPIVQIGVRLEIKLEALSALARLLIGKGTKPRFILKLEPALLNTMERECESGRALGGAHREDLHGAEGRRRPHAVQVRSIAKIGSEP
jgi:hypothetical protein